MEPNTLPSQRASYVRNPQEERYRGKPSQRNICSERVCDDAAERRELTVKSEDDHATTLKPGVTIQNVVASARFKHGFDLNAIVKAFPMVEYRPVTFPGLVFRLKKPKASALIFSSGKMVCTGTKSEKDAKRAVNKVARELRKAGLVIHGRPEINIVNIVASVDLGDVIIDLETGIYTAHTLGVKVVYEPDQFPGAIYRMEDPKTVFLIFNTGKLVCTGAKREEDVYRAVAKLAVILDENDLIMPGGAGFE